MIAVNRSQEPGSKYMVPTGKILFHSHNKGLFIIYKLIPHHLCFHLANKILVAAQDGLLQVAKKSTLLLQGFKSHQVGVTVAILK